MSDEYEWLIRDSLTVVEEFNFVVDSEYWGVAITPTWQWVTVYETVWVPPVSYKPGTPTIPPTEAQLSYSKNEGWNTWARSIDELTQGEYLEFTCYQNTHGLFIGIGPALHLGHSISLFSHGVVCDVDGIHVYENGEVSGVLLGSFDINTKLKIFWQADGTIVYVATAGTDTDVHTSSSVYEYEEAYVFGYLYSSDDTVQSSEFKTGTVQYGSV